MPLLDRRPARLTGLLLAAVLAVLGALAWPAGARAAAPGPEPAGVWPLVPRPEVVAAFQQPSDPWGPGHRGVDLLGAVGQPVRAALGGRISYAGRLAGRGVVVVDHGATRTTYEPVAASVGLGDEVATGGRIGRLELAGSHCFPRACLHWGWLRGQAYLDPLGLVGAGPVRLLPLWREDPAPGPASPPLPYAAWRPWSPAGLGAQARGCACW